MSDDKGNGNLDKEIFDRFSRIAREKLTAVADNSDGGGDQLQRLDALYKRPEFDAEKRILTEMNDLGLGKGVLAGLGCFAFLRLSPRALARMLQRRAGVAAPARPNPFQRAAGYKLDPVASAGPTNQANAERPGLVFRLFRFTLDAFCSVSVGAYASLYFIDKNKLLKQVADIPLVEGRSLISEELCDDFTREFRKFDRQTWDPHHPALSGDAFARAGDGGTMDFRTTVQGFVANCRRRALYEDDARRDRGAGRAEPVVVPPPGVPRDGPVGLDELLEERGRGGEGGDEGPAAGEEYFDAYFCTDDETRD